MLATLALPLSGCSAKKGDEATPTNAPEVVDPAADTPSVASISNEAAVASANAFTYSDSLDDRGYWKDVKALDIVTIPDLSTVSIPSAVHSIDDATVDSTIESYLTQYATTEQITDRAVENNDLVNIDYVGSIDGVEFEGGTTEGRGTDVTAGSTNYIDDFLIQIIGHTPGETFDVNVTFPDEYGVDELNGKDALFVTTINYISSSTPAVLNDEFVAEKLSADYSWNTVAEMRAGIQENLKSQSIDNYILDEVIATAPVTSVPDSILQYQVDAMVKYYLDGSVNYGVTFDEFLAQYVGVTTVDELVAANNEMNTQSSKETLVIQAIAEDAGIVATTEELAPYFKKNFNVSEDDYSNFETNYGQPYLKQALLRTKVTDYIKEKAVYE
jgi:trigger factor